jgi:hypothetical protein
VNDCKTAMEKLEEWATPEKPPVPEWRQSFGISIHPVPRGVALMISFVVFSLFLSPGRFIDDSFGLFSVRGTIQLFSP